MSAAPIWLVTIGEPLPTDGPEVRLLRTGMVARHLAADGQEVLWWTSDFDHHRKIHRTGSDSRIELSPHLHMQLLHGCGYRRHVSFARFRDHRQHAEAFLRIAPTLPRPSAIVAGYPSIVLTERH